MKRPKTKFKGTINICVRRHCLIVFHNPYEEDITIIEKKIDSFSVSREVEAMIDRMNPFEINKIVKVYFSFSLFFFVG